MTILVIHPKANGNADTNKANLRSSSAQHVETENDENKEEDLKQQEYSKSQQNDQNKVDESREHTFATNLILKQVEKKLLKRILSQAT